MIVVGPDWTGGDTPKKAAEPFEAIGGLVCAFVILMTICSVPALILAKTVGTERLLKMQCPSCEYRTTKKEPSKL